MTDVLLIGFVAMSGVALATILYGFRLTKTMNSREFRRAVFEEVARENYRRHVQLRETDYGRN